MDYEHETKVIPIDEALPEQLKAMQADGWVVLPGSVPVAVYHVLRPKNRPKTADIGAAGGLAIDETKVQILRNGKLLPLSDA